MVSSVDRTDFQTNGIGAIWCPYGKNIKLGHEVRPYIQISSRWVKDINITWKAIKLLCHNKGEYLHSFRVGKNFLSKLKKYYQKGQDWQLHYTQLRAWVRQKTAHREQTDNTGSGREQWRTHILNTHAHAHAHNFEMGQRLKQAFF